MGRNKKKPEYDPDKIMDEIFKTVLEAYESLDQVKRSEGQLAHGALKELSDLLDFKPSKVKKLLITAGERENREIFSNDSARQVMDLHKAGKTTTEIMKTTGLKRSSVLGYLPYSKTVYKASELSTDAERIKLFRERQQKCRSFNATIIDMDMDEKVDYLWETLVFLQGCIFRTEGRGRSPVVKFQYRIRGGEMFIDRKEKSITRATVRLAFERAIELQEKYGFISGPKKLECSEQVIYDLRSWN